MNLFLVSWHLPKDREPMAVVALRCMHDIYPQLDPDTLWQTHSESAVFAASMQTPTGVIGGRQYVWRGPGETVLYEGALVQPEGKFPAHQAASLAAHWDGLAEEVEGQFVAIRVRERPACLEVITDALGLEQVYYWHQGNQWILSNSVELLSRITNSRDLDPLGVTLFLTLSWAGGDRTLKHDIRVMPGAQLWHWCEDRRYPIQQSYYSLATLARRGRSTSPDVRGLTAELQGCCRQLALQYQPLQCPITSGRDSRLLAALLMSADIDAEYYTSGDPDSVDVRVGTAIAQRFGLTHEISEETAASVLESWEPASRRLIRQNDGMVSLWQIADVMHQPSTIDALPLTLWGIGGEIARGEYSEPALFLSSPTVAGVEAFLAAHLIQGYGGLISKEAMQCAADWLHASIGEAVEQGFDVLDIPNAFYTWERVRRWGGSQGRKSRGLRDRFTPFCTRPFLGAAFALKPLARCAETLHYALMRYLSPELHAFPFGNGRWPPQSPPLTFIEMILRQQAQRIHRWQRALRRRVFTRHEPASQLSVGFDRRAWLEAKREWLQALCLDQAHSPLWDFIDRGVFERVSSDTSHPGERHSRLIGFYQAATLFLYALV